MPQDPVGRELGEHDLAGGEHPGVEEVPAEHLAGRLAGEDVQVAVDVALLTSFGPLTLTDFQVRATPVA